MSKSQPVQPVPVSVPVSVIVPVHNGREMLADLLASLERQSVSPCEIIVVDDGSTDDAPDLARQAGAKVVTMGRNAGFVAAVNRGVQDAQGEVIALINSDVILDERWLEALWQALEEQAADFATGTILQNDRVIDGTYDLISRAGTAWRAGAGQPANPSDQCTRPIRFCSATAVLYRTSLLQELGGFEVAFESYLEDVDLGIRCAVRDKRGIYCPRAICYHRGSASFGRWSARAVRLISRNQVLLVSRHYPASLLRRWIWPVLVGQLLWGALAIRHGRGLAWFLGKLDGLRRFSSTRGTSDVRSLVEECEREIYRRQSTRGFDTYWRAYFALAGRPE